MNDHLNRGIKEVIKQFPEVASILEEYNIGCVPCNVGSCLLKDVVEIHNLSPEDETELMSRIAAVIYPDRVTRIPSIKRREGPASREKMYSPPMRKLVEEHKVIKRLVSMIPEIVRTMDLESEDGGRVIKDCVDFIRNYADRYHHAKEEDIVLKYFDENLDIIKTIYLDHETARSHVKAILEGVEERSESKVSGHLIAYHELLSEHITKEDDILYPWMDRNISTTQVGRIFSEFVRVDEKFNTAPKRYEELIKKLEKRYQTEEVKR